MPKISLAGFKDPVRRPRYIIWTGVAVLVLALVMIVALGVTSTRWFCSEGCHKVQDDTIIAYERSTHSNVSCMSCHMPVNANPVVFILHKAEALGELYLTVTDQFELPLNGHSEVSLVMPERQCTQCHNLKNREVTPSSGIKIDHEVHGEVNAACPVCHNRVAHIENFELTLKDPNTGEPNKKHADFMSMTACFRCHGLEQGAAAPGTCAACHTPGFDLKPPSHKEKEFFPKGHAELAKEMKAESEAAKAGEGEGSETEGEKPAEEGTAAPEGEKPAEEGTAAPEGEKPEGNSGIVGPEEAHASGGPVAESVSKEEVPQIIAAQRKYDAHGESIGAQLPKVEEIFYCSTCHTDKFCTDCHGMEMPHPAEFREPKDAKDAKGHPAVSKAKADKCVMCHGENEKTHFCDSCHHGKSVDWEYDAKVAWQQQHPKAVAKSGVKSCTEKCHEAKFCVDCHTGRKVIPASHKQGTWTKPKAPGALTVYGKTPAKPSAKHSLAALDSVESCEVCHGSGGINASFCKSCHRLEMPHAAEFKTNHVSSRKNASVCSNCHLWPELCSNCHHIGASTSKPWLGLHGQSVNKSGVEGGGCLKCHGGEKGDSKDFCVKCHTARKVKPASHNAKNFTRDYSSKKAAHVQLYTKDGEICTYCHAGTAAELPKSKFCSSCHKLPMPHPDGFGAKGSGNGGEHQKLFEQKKTNKAVCANCHQTAFCDSCHHEGSTPKVPWAANRGGVKVQHPAIVKKDGAQACFECHEETFCSACHVRLN